MGKSLGLVGRHKYHVTPEILQAVEKFASKLYSKTQISACLGISIDTFIRKSKESADFAAAYERGWAKGLINEAEKLEKVEAGAYYNATNPAIDKDGNPVGPQGGDPGMQKFILQSKAGWTPNKLEVSGNPDKPILIAPLFAKNYQKDLDKFTQVIDEAND